MFHYGGRTLSMSRILWRTMNFLSSEGKNGIPTCASKNVINSSIVPWYHFLMANLHGHCPLNDVRSSKRDFCAFRDVWF